jgi:hypothetical protein
MLGIGQRQRGVDGAELRIQEHRCISSVALRKRASLVKSSLYPLYCSRGTVLGAGPPASQAQHCANARTDRVVLLLVLFQL